MKPIKNRYKVMAALITLVIITSITIFSINLAKAKHVYEENILLNTEFFDADFEEKLFYAYTDGQSVIIQEKTFGGTTLDERELVSDSPHKLDLLVKTGVPYLTWISIGNQINVYDGENIIIVCEDGSTPRLFSVGNNVYVTWIKDKTLLVSPIGESAEWEIATMVSDYSIYNYNGKIYITYVKDNIVCFKTFNQGVWGAEQSIYVGSIPHFIRTAEISYIYYRDTKGNLGCFYGMGEDIKLVLDITTIDVEEIVTHKDILAFTLKDGLFMQRITDEGFSDVVNITSNPATKINVFYVDEDNLMFTYVIQGRAIYKLVSLPSIANATVKPLVFEIFGGEDVAKKTAFDYIADYNLRNIAPEGKVMNFIVSHSGETLAVLSVIVIGFVIGLTIVMGRRREAKNVTK